MAERKKKKGMFSKLAQELKDVINKPSAYANVNAAKALADEARKKRRRKKKKRYSY